MACMMSMTNLAKKRPQFMTQVIEGFEALHGNHYLNIPPARVGYIPPFLIPQTEKLNSTQTISDSKAL